MHLVPSRREEKFRKEGENSETVDKVNTVYLSDFGHVVNQDKLPAEGTDYSSSQTDCFPAGEVHVSAPKRKNPPIINSSAYACTQHEMNVPTMKAKCLK